MATLLFAAAGSAIGAALGGTVFGVSSVVAGRAIGAMIGNQIDQTLLMPSQKVTGPRLDSLDIQTSEEGAGLPVVEGHGRIAGQVIWATRLEEVTKKSKKGGKGGPTVKTTDYSYYANFAVALTDCATGPIRHFGRIWADGKPLDTSDLTVRYYTGTDAQTPDPLIVAKDGAAPAYRGVSYVVFERMPVNDYANRIPALTFEVWGPSGEMEDMVRGVDLIPASTEFGYAPEVIEKGYTETVTVGSGEDFSFTREVGTGRENAVRDAVTSDWSAAMDLLSGTLPNCGTVALVVSWFGTDLRAAHCQIEPRVERADKSMKTRPWSAAGLTRETANVVSQIDGDPAFGGAPDDQSIIDAIQDLKSRGYRVVLYPFVMMDIEAGNTLPTRDGATGQPVYPWRGRIGPASADGAVAAQVAALVGTAQPADFTAGTDVPTYSGPDEWSYRRFILHLAALARAAGGVDAFLIGSELVDLTTATAAPGVYPFVDALVALAADVKGMLPAAAVSYAADWSEYHSHRNGGEVFFHMDSLWSSPHVDFIGIDNYLPVSDWRPGTNHADYDAAAGVTSPYLLDYLKSNIEGGEYWDWYYASDADRLAQVRTPIADLGHGEDWVFRQKAIRDWHGNTHHHRPGGVRDASATGWVPGSKPVWFTEFGCPAVDLGGNQPNVFFDPKSSESFLPHFSNGARDDFMQRQYLRAMMEWWSDNGGTIVDPDNMFVWAWDARPWPEFPRQADLWSDGPNWERGHWLNGRAGSAPAAETIARRLAAHYEGATGSVDLSRCFGQADGLVLSGPLSLRDMMGTWETALRLDTSEWGGAFTVAARSAARVVAEYGESDLVERDSGALYTITRTALEETPRTAVVRYSDTDLDYETGAARAGIKVGSGQAEASAELAIVSDLPRMTRTAEVILRAAADAREAVEFSLPPSSTLAPGDLFTLTPRGGRAITFVVDQITRGTDRQVRATIYSGAVLGSAGGPPRPSPALISQPSDTVAPVMLDLPILPGVDMDGHQGLVAMLSEPWPGGADLYRSVDQETGYDLNLQTGLSGSVGETVSDLPPGLVALWSPETVEVHLYSGGLVSASELDVLNGANALAIEHAPGDWEVLQFQTATLIASQTWRLSGLLRGQLGTEWVRDPGGLAAGARVVVLDAGIIPVDMSTSDVARPYYWRAVPSDKDPSHTAEVAHTFAGVGLRPYAPVHLRAEVSGGVLALSWVRRTRFDGDSWDVVEVPLNEASERYLVEVGPEGAPDLSAEVSTTSASGLDVSALSGAVEVRVAQISDTYGAGTWARLELQL